MRNCKSLAVIAAVLFICTACAGNAPAESAAVSPSASITSITADAPSVGSEVQASATAGASSLPETPEEPSHPPEPEASLEPLDVHYSAIPLPDEMRAMWVSFLEWQAFDISTEAALRANVGQMFDHCSAMGLNTVIVAVRPFADALYESAYYPWSHLITGVQGQDPGFDPLFVMVEEAHARNLRFEAWVNPYRVSHPEHGPETLAQDNPAALNPSWVREQYGLWLDPGLPEVRELVIGGITELVENYDVDGIHFDDYFYPEGNTSAFDEQTYAQYGDGQERAAWRRENVNTMIRSVYAAVKEANASVSFGVSPQGNNENNYNEQHCDINLWMAQPGYADYIMPQLYWGFNYTRNGNNKAAFANKTAEWSSYTLCDDVELYAGLGAYRIGGGDGSDAGDGEWQSGRNLADMVAHLRTVDGFGGFALFHYTDLYPVSVDAPYGELAAQEAAALTALLQ